MEVLVFVWLNSPSYQRGPKITDACPNHTWELLGRVLVSTGQNQAEVFFGKFNSRSE